jgi:hypothetical protein
VECEAVFIGSRCQENLYRSEKQWCVTAVHWAPATQLPSRHHAFQNIFFQEKTLLEPLTPSRCVNASQYERARRTEASQTCPCSRSCVVWRSWSGSRSPNTCTLQNSAQNQRSYTGSRWLSFRPAASHPSIIDEHQNGFSASAARL